MTRAVIWTVLTMAGASGLAAQGPGVPLLVQLPASTRALGLGNAYPLGSTDADAIFYNPALLSSARGISGSIARYGSSSTLAGVAGAAEWWRGGVGLAVRALSWGAASPESGAFARGEAGLSESGGTAASELVATAAWARSFFGFRFGLAGKLIDLRAPGERSVTVAADLGVARSLGRVTIGVSGRNLGRDPDLAATNAELPATITLGAGTRTAAVGPLDLMLAASASWMRGDQLAAGGGVEISYWPVTGRTFAGRVGYRWVEDSDVRPLTVGAGFTGDRLAIDYAFEDVDGGDPIHRVTLRLR